MPKQRIMNEWRTFKKGKKQFKIKYWDNLGYDQYKIVNPDFDFLGVFLIKKNKKRYLKRVYDNNLQDYVVPIEIMEDKE